MANVARLTWGLSFCKLKIPSFLLDIGVGKQGISSSSFCAASTVLNLKTNLLSRRQKLQSSLRPPLKQASLSSNEDIELASITDSPQISSQCYKGNFKLIHAGISDPSMRFLIYLVSLALSLAALSILKLHELLEWLIVDSDAPAMTNRLQELRTKSAVISEILRAAALRYSCCDLHTSEATPIISSSSFQQHLIPSVTPTSTSICNSESSHMSSKPGLCFHTHGMPNEMSEQCLLCLVQGNIIYMGSGIMRHRCHSDSTVTPASRPVAKWSKPSRLNAGICRTQVVSNYSTWCFSLEMCSSQHSSLDNKSGLQLASAVRHGSSRVWSLSLDPVTPPQSQTLVNSTSSPLSSQSKPLYNRSKKLVACVAPTSTGAEQSVFPQSSSPTLVQSSSMLKISPESRCSSVLFGVLEQEAGEKVEEEPESVFFSEEARPVTLPEVAPPLSPVFFPSTPPMAPIVRRDCGVNTRTQTRDAASSPHLIREVEDEGDDDLECSGDHPDAEGLELDEEGVYFAFDYCDRSPISPDEDDGEEFGGNEVLEGLEESHLSCTEELQYGEGLSDLVALTTSISDDLLQLESGCQELIHRVHANRIELDRVNDSLSFVWDNKDECTVPVTASGMMEKSWSSCDGESTASVYTHRYSPLGASFISTGSCCHCNCHREEGPIQQLGPESVAEVPSTPTIVKSDSFKDEKFLHLATSLDDDVGTTWCDSTDRSHPCVSPLCHCPMPDSITSINRSRLARNNSS